MRPVILSAFSGIVLTLAGCVSVLPKSEPPAPRYVMSPVSVSSAFVLPDNLRLAVADPVSSQLFNTVKIALSREPNRFEFYAGTEWADRAPVLFQRALIRSFEDSGAIAQVGDFTVIPVGDYVLHTDIRALQANYVDGGDPVVRTVFFARLLKGDGNIIASERFDISQPANDDDLPEIMNAFDQSLDEAMSRIVRWSIMQLANQTSHATVS